MQKKQSKIKEKNSSNPQDKKGRDAESKAAGGALPEAASWLTLIYFWGGTCALIYEVLWARLIKLTIGNTVQAAGVVVTVFMGGLALGSLLMGRYADRIGRRLRVYAYVELCVAAAALLIPLELRLFGRFYTWIFTAAHASPLALLTAQVVICSILLLIPTTLMGSTLPLLGRYVTGISTQTGVRVGWLYTWNTLGGALGCFLAGFVLIGTLGVMHTLYAAVFINFMVALGAWYLSRSEKSSGGNAAAVQSNPKKSTRSAGDYILLMALFISGFVSIGYQMVWMRSIVYLLGGYTYVFAGVLTSYLVGYVVGTSIGSNISGTIRQPQTAFGFSLIILGFCGTGFMAWYGLWSSEPLQSMLHAVLSMGNSAPSIDQMGSKLLNALAIFVLPSVVMGAGFPLALQAWTLRHHDVGRSVGAVYGANTIGAVLGGLTSVFVLIPLAGAERSIIALGAAAMVAGIVAIEQHLPLSKRPVRIAAYSCLIAAVFFFPSNLYKKNIINPEGAQTLAVHEGITTTVCVYEKDSLGRFLELDNVGMAGDGFHRSAQQMLGHLGLLLHKNAADVLSIGYGCGETVYCMSGYHGTNIECVEIAPEVVTAANRFFSHINLGSDLEKKVKMVYMDARNYIAHVNKRYDIIQNDANTHDQAGSAALFTKEHFENARSHLNPGGLFITKLHINSLSPLMIF